jgi:hypothetical protein
MAITVSSYSLRRKCLYVFFRSANTHLEVLLLPVNAGDRTGIHGLLNEIFGAPFGLNDFCLFVPFLHLKNLGTDFHAGSATDAFFLVEIHCLAHAFLLASSCSLLSVSFMMIR